MQTKDCFTGYYFLKYNDTNPEMFFRSDIHFIIRNKPIGPDMIPEESTVYRNMVKRIIQSRKGFDQDGSIHKTEFPVPNSFSS